MQDIIKEKQQEGILASDEVKAAILPEQLAQRVAEFYKVIGDTTRVKILALLEERELCVSEIVDALAMGQSAVSHQLRVLRSAHLVTYRKEGKMAYYRLDDDHVTQLLRQGIEHIRHIGEGS